MKKIPNVIVTDGFFEDPEEVRELAMSLPYSRPARTNYPGERTSDLSVVVPAHFAMWKEKFMDLFSGVHNGDWAFSTQFQRIATDLDDPEANEGWIHNDPGEDIGGVIYLNPCADPDAGTSFMRPKESTNPHMNSNLRFRNDYYGGRNAITTEEFVRAKAFNNAKYETDMAVSNQYNRMVAFDCKKPHKQTTFGSSRNAYRLTQVFFARKLY